MFNEHCVLSSFIPDYLKLENQKLHYATTVFTSQRNQSPQVAIEIN